MQREAQDVPCAWTAGRSLPTCGLTGALPAGRWKRDVIAPSVQLSKKSQNQMLRGAGRRLWNLGTRTR